MVRYANRAKNIKTKPVTVKLERRGRGADSSRSMQLATADRARVPREAMSEPPTVRDATLWDLIACDWMASSHGMQGRRPMDGLELERGRNARASEVARVRR